MPKKVREHLGFAVNAINAYERGVSLPDVALHYRYDPISAMSMIATCCKMYDYASVALHVPGHIMSLVEAQHPTITAPRA